MVKTPYTPKNDIAALMAVKNLTSPRAPVPRPADLLTVADSPWRGFLLRKMRGLRFKPVTQWDFG